MPAFLAPLAISAGSALINRFLSGKKKAAQPVASSYDRDLEQRSRQASAMEEEYLQMLRSFDPTAGFDEATDASLDRQEEDFATSYANRLGQMAGRGRLPTRSGFGLRDAQDTVRQGQREREEIRRAGAGQAQAARAAHLDRMGSFAGNMGNRYFNAREGRINTAEAQAQANSASKRGLFGQVLGGVIGALPEAYRAYRGR